MKHKSCLSCRFMFKFLINSMCQKIFFIAISYEARLLLVLNFKLDSFVSDNLNNCFSSWFYFLFCVDCLILPASFYLALLYLYVAVLPSNFPIFN